MVQLDKYLQRGVSADKHEVHEAIKGLDTGLFDKSFCKILPDYIGNDKDYCIIMHADTAGTKSSLAYIYWKETGDINVWKGIVEDALVMNMDDMACVGCIDNFIISSTIGRNKSIVTGDVLKVLIQHTSEYTKKLKQYGVNMYLAGGETADVGDIVRTADVGFTIFARMKKSNLIINDIKAGNVIVALASHGKAIYEENYNSGIGSNGLTSARHDVLAHKYYEKYPESYNSTTEESLLYSGSKNLEDTIHINGENIPIGKLLLSPTRTFLPIMNQIIPKFGDKIDGIIHNTGGGLTKVLKFISNKKIIKKDLIGLPPIFKLIQEESGMDWYEMNRVFNMGNRMEFYTDQETALGIIEIAKSFQVEAKIIGYVEDHTYNEVLVQTENGDFHYK
jgi:phosphoribosylformylglycinamidine cyclo-ligase